MYVQYQVPLRGREHVPVVMVHGCCLSSKAWETTPDGRMGWSEYFVRKNRPVYLADQVSRARSGFDPTKISGVKAGAVPPSELPNILVATHQFAWSVFGFGSTFGTAFPDEQFPVEAVDELHKQISQIQEIGIVEAATPNSYVFGQVLAVNQMFREQHQSRQSVRGIN